MISNVFFKVYDPILDKDESGKLPSSIFFRPNTNFSLLNVSNSIWKLSVGFIYFSCCDQIF